MTTKMLFGAGILLAIATLSSAGAVGSPSRNAADHSFVNYMLKNKFSDDPELITRCFVYYMPILNNITEEFSSSFQQCQLSAYDQIKKLNDNAARDRYQIEKSADGVCVRMDSCNDYSLALDYLDCISGQGNDNTKVIYGVTQNSTEKAATLREQYRIVEVDKYKCQNASERAYVEGTAIYYKELDLCLQGEDIPSTTVGPQTTTQSTPTTEKDDETTPTSAVEDTSATTESEPQDTTTAPPANEDLSNGRGLKILTELRRFWRN